MLDENRKIDMDVSNYETPNVRMEVDTGVPNTWIGNVTIKYTGYATLNELYSAAVTKEIDTCNHEDNVTDIESKPKFTTPATEESESETAESAETEAGETENAT